MIRCPALAFATSLLLLCVLPAGIASAAVDLKVNFQPTASTVPAGYSKDIGAAYDSTAGSGWIRQDSVSQAVQVPLDVTANSRARNGVPDPRLATFIHMQFPSGSTGPGTFTPAAWEANVPAGTYTVTVAVGDSAYYNSTHSIRVEGQPVITSFIPSSSTAFKTVTATVAVTDGKITVDAIGGTNTKIDYLTISDASDTTPPAAPTGVGAIPGDSEVKLDWNANSESDLAGYDVFRSTTLPVSTADAPLNGGALLTSTTFTDTTAFNGTQYHYVVRASDASGNKATSAPVTATPQGGTTIIDRRWTFQPAGVQPPTGYTADTGLAFSATRGFGWIRQDSVRAQTRVPLDVSGNARKRYVNADPRLDSFIHMQFEGASGTANVQRTPAAWEANVPAGSYDVEIGVGDPSYFNSSHQITVEGQVLIPNFVPSTAVPFKTVSRTISVSDGKLSIDAIGGTNTKINYVTIATAPAGARPSIRSVAPANAATGINRRTSVTADLVLPNVGAGVDDNTLTESTVRLVRSSDGSQVPANRNTSGGGDVVVLQPTVTLAANTQYRFEVTSGLKDFTGAPFVPTSSVFTTGTLVGSGETSPARFEQVALPSATGKSFSSLTKGPDGKLYAVTLEGEVVRFPINADGTTGTAQTITSLTAFAGGPRMITGLTFDPASTASNPILWVSHNEFAYVDAPDFTGAVARMSGANLETVRNYVVGLPRSVSNHETNSIEFGPDGALYLSQGSNSATGQTDDVWGQRPERLLNAALLRINTSAIGASPVNVQTEAGGSYNPFAAGAPVTIHATGLRNAFDFVFHSNGELYAPTNGSAAGGNTPATPSPLPASCSSRIDSGTAGAYTGPSVATVSNLASAQDDYLYRVKQGGYYGHPNPSRCEWVLNGGNPTSATDPGEVPQYPVGVQPDRNWRGISYNFGKHFSPNGVIEYRGGAFGGALRGQLLVVRYSAGDDVIALAPGGSSKDIINAESGITGFTGFNDPLDITEDRANGNLYVTELGASRITLLRPVETGGNPEISTAASRLVTNDIAGGAAGTPKNVTIQNTGSGPLSVTGLTLSGANAGDFALPSAPSLPATIAGGETLDVEVAFGPSTVGVKDATLRIASNDEDEPTLDVSLRGLGTAGSGGTGEPSLQRVLDAYEVPVNVADPDPNTADLPSTNPLGDEVPLQRMRKAGTGNVTIEPLAVFAPTGPSTTAGTIGWNLAGTTSSNTQLATIPNGSAQALDPLTNGSLSFDPGNVSFGLYSTWAAFSNRAVYSEDSLNTFSGALPHNVRFYKLKTAAGAVVPNAYVMATEEFTSAYDFQDLVAIVRNVEPAATNARLSLTNLDGLPASNRLVFNRIGSLASPPADGVHDRSTVRIKNTGTDPLTVSGLSVTGPFQLVSPPSLPATLAPNAQIDVTVRFTAQTGRISNGTFTIASDDPSAPSTAVELAGYWQTATTEANEPKLEEVVNGLYGYDTVILNAGQSVNQTGRQATIGEEVLSPYWRRVDPSKAVNVTQLGAFHQPGAGATLQWHSKGGEVPRNVVSMATTDAQSILPRKAGSTTALATAAFFPAAQFGFRVGSEFSDDQLNRQIDDENNGCTQPCGHHMRFFPLKDSSGAVVPGSYLMAMDYSGINYDYQDNIYLLTNMEPDTDQPTLQRIDVGGINPYTDTSGRVWSPDTGLFSPSTAPIEGETVTPLAIANTTDDPLYRTYRGNVGDVPQSQRIIDFNLPVGSATKVDVRLHLAERFSGNNAASRRLFDVYAEGVKVFSNQDIFSSSGGLNTAYARAIDDIAVTDGELNLSLRATVNYPSVSGIEVLCAANCGGAAAAARAARVEAATEAGT